MWWPRNERHEAGRVEKKGFKRGYIHAWKIQEFRGSELVKAVVQDWEEDCSRDGSIEKNWGKGDG